jgi:hypothetical protein
MAALIAASDIRGILRAEPRLVLFHKIGQHGKSIDGDPISPNNPTNDLSALIANEIAVHI